MSRYISIQSTPSKPASLKHISYYPPIYAWSSKWFFSSAFPYQNPLWISLLQHTCYTPHQSYPDVADHLNNISCRRRRLLLLLLLLLILPPPPTLLPKNYSPLYNFASSTIVHHSRLSLATVCLSFISIISIPPLFCPPPIFYIVFFFSIFLSLWLSKFVLDHLRRRDFMSSIISASVSTIHKISYYENFPRS